MTRTRRTHGAPLSAGATIRSGGALFALAMALAAPASLAAAPAANGRIAIVRSATVDGATVRLADIAVLEGDAAELADVEIGPAPDPGGSRRFEGVAILRTLRTAGLDTAGTRYEIPATVRVARTYQDVGAEELRAAIEPAVTATLAAGEQLRAVDVGGSVRIPQGTYEVRVAAPAAGGGMRRRVDASVVQDGAVVATTTARVEIAASGPVVILRRAVARGTVLGPGDVDVEDRDLTGLPAGVVTSVADAVGKETRAALPAGAPLTLSSVTSPLLVRRGDLVTVIVETPGMRLSTPGEALEPGAAGVPIRVRNRTSQQELSGQVVDRGIVFVQY
jgi:flagella basal body P-ring formation protein FlgA